MFWQCRHGHIVMRLFQHEVEEGGKWVLGGNAREENETFDSKKCVYEWKEKCMSSCKLV